MIIHSHKELIVWQKSMDLVDAVYQLTDQFPQSELYRLTSQMNGSVVSIPSNISEGRRRKTRKDFCRFLFMAYASGAELETQIAIAKRTSFGKNLDYQKIDLLLNEVMRMLNIIVRKMRNPPKS